jgi:hypothetical protein
MNFTMVEMSTSLKFRITPLAMRTGAPEGENQQRQYD